MRKIPYILYIVAVAMMLVGCNVRLAKPQLTKQEEYLFGKGFSHDTIALGENWWRMFGDTTLNRLVERALVQNKSIKIATSRIEEARHNLVVARSAYWFSLSATISAEGKYERFRRGDIGGNGDIMAIAQTDDLQGVIRIFNIRIGVTQKDDQIYFVIRDTGGDLLCAAVGARKHTGNL